MSNLTVSDWSTTAASNTEVGGVDLAENSMRPRDVNNAIRTMMAQIATGIDNSEFGSLPQFHPATAAGPASFDFAEDTDNGTNKVTLIAPSSIASDKTVTFQDITGTLYVTGGTDVALADGGTGATLVDPNADRIMFWDDSAGQVTWLSSTANLVINGTTLRAYETHGIALSDETTAITTGTGKGSFSLPYAFTLVGVYVTLNTVSSSGTPTFDFNEAGTTCLSTKVVIDVSEFTGGSSGYQGTAAAAAVISDASLAAFAQLTWDIDTAGTGAKGAKAYIIGYPT